MNQISLTPIHNELDALFEALNEKFYQNELIHPVLTIIPKGKRKCLGWCTSTPVWERKKSIENQKCTEYYEINICAETLSMSFEDMAELMLHEMAHLYNCQHEVKDTSRSGTYHNKEFLYVAETHGLCVEKDNRCGYARTSLNCVAKEFLETLDQFVFELSRVDRTTKTSKRQSLHKVKCPMCDNVAYVTSIKNKFLCYYCHTQVS